MGYNIINLNDMYNDFKDECKEDRFQEILSSFSCPLNKDIEIFFRDKALEFSKQGIAATHIVATSFKKEMVIVGYFAIASKSVCIKRKLISSTYAKRISKFSKYNDDIKGYNISLPLIAQLGKNYTKGANQLITGAELLEIACDEIRSAQKIVGGKMVYLECEDIKELRDFYKENGFISFGERMLEKSEKGLFTGEYLIQMMRYLH